MGQAIKTIKKFFTEQHGVTEYADLKKCVDGDGNKGLIFVKENGGQSKLRRAIKKKEGSDDFEALSEAPIWMGLNLAGITEEMNAM